jgi:hypothetical protein
LIVAGSLHLITELQGLSVEVLFAHGSFLAYRRLQGSYPATLVEEVIKANRRGSWTINAVTGCAVKKKGGGPQRG